MFYRRDKSPVSGPEDDDEVEEREKAEALPEAEETASSDAEETDSSVRCEECGKVCATPSHLTLHQFTHKRPSAAPTATTAAASSVAPSAAAASTQHQCKLCPRAFAARSLLQAHSMSQHSTMVVVPPT